MLESVAARRNSEVVRISNPTAAAREANRRQPALILWGAAMSDLAGAAAVEALRNRDMEAYGLHDREFHETIAERSENAALIETLSRLALQIQICRTIANESKEFAERAAKERDDILKALRARDAAAASALMRAHISDVQSAVLARLPKEMAER